MATIATLPMGPATLNITDLVAGDKNQVQITITQSGAPVNLTALTVTAQARNIATDPDPATITCVITVVDAPAGVVQLRFPGTEVTAALAGELTWAGVWDLQTRATGQDPVTVVAGTVTARMDVTRP